jgi:hypothetical protein
MKQPTDWTAFFNEIKPNRLRQKSTRPYNLKGGDSNERTLRLRSLDTSEQTRPAAFTFNLDTINEALSLI